MKASELRIGNWYYGDNLNGGDYQITAKDILELNDDPQDDYYQPIPLTEEWLLKFGFDVDVFANGTEFGLDESGIACLNYGEIGIRKINHVHTLQNLYFALTGEELKIKNK